MSRRSERAREGKAREAEAGAARRGARAGERDASAGGREDHAAGGWGLPLQILLLIAIFAVTTGIAELAGAANLGVALGIGQIAFALAVVYLLLRR